MDGTILELEGGKDWYGSAEVTITATDGEYTVQQVVAVRINGVNDAPVAVEIPAISFDEDTAYALDLSAYFSDVDSELTYTVSKGHYVMPSITGSVLTIKGEKDWFGVDEIIVTASDGEYTVTKPVHVSIRNVNDPPILLAENVSLEIKSGTILEAFNLDDYFADIDSSTLTFSVEGNAEVLVYIDVETHNVTIEAPSSITHPLTENFYIRATDGTSYADLPVEVRVLPSGAGEETTMLPPTETGATATKVGLIAVMLALLGLLIYYQLRHIWGRTKKDILDLRNYAVYKNVS